MCEKQYKRYLVMGLKNGELHHIIARRGETPEDIVDRAIAISAGPPFLTKADQCAREFDRMYLLEVGDEGTFGSSTNLKLQEIVPPPVSTAWTLVRTKGLYR